MTSRSLSAVLTIVAATGCASSHRDLVGHSRTPDQATPDPGEYRAPRADSGTDPLLGIDEPFHGQWLPDGELLSDVGLLDALAQFDLVCVGERHDEALDHWAQLAVLYGLSTRAEMAGRDLALGLEMVEHTFQPELDRYFTGELALAELPDQVEWASRWGFDFALYRPLFELADSQRLPVLGLNAPREITRAVAREGLQGLDTDDRDHIPRWLDFHDEEHRRGFDAAMAEHPHHGNREHLYAAQVVWDETMATQVAAWLAQRQPARQVVVAAGRAHCRYSAIPARVRRRLHDTRVVSVLPTRDPGEAAETTGYDIAMVLGTDQ